MFNRLISFIIIAGLISSQAYALPRPVSNNGIIDTVNVGGYRSFTDTANLIILNGIMSATTNGSGMRKAGSSSAYTVTTGKTLHIYALAVMNEGTGVTCSVVLAQTNNDIGWNQAVSGYTSPVYENGDSTWGRLGGADRSNSNDNRNLYYSLDFPILAGKILSVGPSSGSVGNGAASLCHVTAYGYETAP